ncbi:TolC family protein [Stratiformator vulcanicus]|uniref:Outer membrane efflux protein n=1 Tax=Stratiformator vulcanicus TaxID=2527980 RepID=A0A517QWD4_9PLAN|nr:TolC family protein [Stratiformator vulcanicus]QDT35914.1 Outer membrane efflux protein [Stratiformator vulcanicus]
MATALICVASGVPQSFAGEMDDYRSLTSTAGRDAAENGRSRRGFQFGHSVPAVSDSAAAVNHRHTSSDPYRSYRSSEDASSSQNRRRTELIRPTAGGASDRQAVVSASYEGRGKISGVEQIDWRPQPQVSAPVSEDQRIELPWWSNYVTRPFDDETQPVSLTLDLVIAEALTHSHRVKEIEVTPYIQQTFIPESIAEFDWTAFAESRLDDLSDPVGNTLTTGGPTRFRDLYAIGRAGIRRKSQWGGEFEAAQQLAYQDNNSDFFAPPQQGTGQLLVSFTQPFLRGSGQSYNESRIILAGINSQTARQEGMEELANHLFEVARAYWSLYRARSFVLQRSRLLKEGERVLRKLEERRVFDVAANQIARARAAVAARRAGLTRAFADLRSAESKLRALVNSPILRNGSQQEFVPAELPSGEHWHFDLETSRAMAMENRPEFAKKLSDLEAARVRAGMARHELLPVLDFAMQAYVSGLDGNSDIAQGFANQYTVGEPSYSVGLFFEIPLGNRAAQAKLKRRELEMSRALASFHTTVAVGMSEVEIAVQETEATWEEMQSRRESMEAAATEVVYLAMRWQLVPEDERVASLLLEQLLDAQDRLVAEEQDFVTAQVRHALAVLEWKRSTGTLLQYLAPGQANQKPAPSAVNIDAGTIVDSVN